MRRWLSRSSLCHCAIIFFVTFAIADAAAIKLPLVPAKPKIKKSDFETQARVAAAGPPNVVEALSGSQSKRALAQQLAEVEDWARKEAAETTLTLKRRETT